MSTDNSERLHLCRERYRNEENTYTHIEDTQAFYFLQVRVKILNYLICCVTKNESIQHYCFSN
jgi:hypothetical protein